MTRSVSLFALSLSLALFACSPSASGNGPAVSDTPAVQSGVSVTLEAVAEPLANPWGMVFLPGGDMLVTLKEDGLFRLPFGATTPVRITGVPDAFTGGQAGYLGLALAPDFATSRTVFMSFSEGTRDSNQTAVLRARLSDDAIALENPTVIFRATPREDTGAHFGSRLAFMADGTLIVTLGDGYKYKEAAQDTANTIGKIVRINADGTIPSDNPYASGPAPAVWSYGHRNVQGLAIDTASGRVFAHEHGPKGGDELNLIVPGQNYGWPAITYGIDYDGTVISPDNAREGMQQPLVKWVPSIAPSGMVLYTGDRYPGWQGDLFIGAMEGPAGRKLVRIDLDAEGKVAGKEHLLTAEGRPIRDVVQGPDGFLYVLTKENEGGIYRVVPKAG